MDSGTNTGLSNTLQQQFEQWLEARKPQELRMLKNYQDMMRISADDDTKGSGISRAQKAMVFVGSTRGKIRAARAKINDVLFGSGKMPYDTEPTNEELAQYSDTVEKIITYQLEEGKFKPAIKTGVDSIATYGTGFIFGPFVKKANKSQVSAQQDAATGQHRLQEMQYEYDCPYYEHGRTMDVYPDPESSDIKEGAGVFWSARKDKDFIRSLKGEDGYSDSAIDAALLEGERFTNTQGSDFTDLLRRNIYRFEKDGRVWFQRFFGRVKKRELEEWRKTLDGSQLNSLSPENEQSQQDQSKAVDDSGEMVEAIIQMAGGHVIKAEENPYKNQRRPASRCVYEDVEHEMWGVGIAENNEPHQKVINAAFRLYLEGKSFALLKTGAVDRSKFSVSEDFKRFPGKLYDMKPGLTPEERKESMIWFDTADVTDGWERVIEMSSTFSDDDTGVTKYTQGNDSAHLNKTATGISMIMNASSLPIKEVIGNIDEMWIEDMIEALIDWDMEYLTPETVKMTIGEKEAQIWGEIQQFGKTSFMKWTAAGAQTFMAREVLMNKLQGFMQIALGNPVTAPLVDARELLEQVWAAGDVGKESPVLSDEDLQKKQSQQQAPGPIDLEKVKAQAAADSKHQQAETDILLRQMDQKHDESMAELNGMIQILLQQMKNSGSANLQDEQLQADAAHKLVDVMEGQNQMAAQNNGQSQSPVISGHPIHGNISQADILTTAAHNNMTPQQVMARLQNG